jgi:hypothetical protein
MEEELLPEILEEIVNGLDDVYKMILLVGVL